MNGLLEFKSNYGEIKDIDSKKRIVTGILANYNLDSHGDIIEKGAFKKTISERGEKILFLNQHKWDQPHGYFKELAETPAGLHFVSNSLPDTSYSNDALELYAAGIVKEHSIGFEVIKSDWDNDKNIRYLKEIKLYEGSNVTLGANSATPFTGFKSIQPEEIDDTIKKIMNVLRKGTLTDETFLQLEIALKQLQTLSIRKGREEILNQPSPATEDTDPGHKEAISVINQFLKNL